MIFSLANALVGAEQFECPQGSKYLLRCNIFFFASAISFTKLGNSYICQEKKMRLHQQQIFLTYIQKKSILGSQVHPVSSITKNGIFQVAGKNVTLILSYFARK